MMKTAGLVVFLVLCGAAAGPAQVTFSLRPAVPCDAINAPRPITVEGETRTLCLQQRAVVDQADIRSAELTNGARGLQIRLTLTDEGSRRLLDMTRRNIGNLVGMVLNGRLVAAPVIEAPVSKYLTIEGHFTGQEAKDIAAAFNRQAGRH